MATALPLSDDKELETALQTVRVSLGSMRRCLELDQLMDALKAASTMLSELRTSALSPKQYYTLYLSVFDALRHLSAYLYEAHTSGKHHLADLYELVQYAGNIVPRLFLMITVGTVYMSIPEAPIKEIMKDMMEMTRGVQHPTRGLFLRHYLSGMTKDYLPIGESEGPSGNLQDSLGFVLTNFIEMNKLWVRLQHQGLSRDRERREMERKELRILVGTNLVRLSQLDGVDLDMYERIILPNVLEQVVNCKDVIAQEYLMEVIIQVFPDEFHLRTLPPFLHATAQLHPKVNIKQIIIALIDRLAAYAAREAESESPEELKRREQEAALRLTEKQAAEITINGDEAETPAGEPKVNGTTEPEKQPADGGVRKYRGIPEDVQLFEVFWQQIVQLLKARPDLPIQDVSALLVSLCNLSLSCYPDRLEYVGQVLGFAQQKVQDFADSPDLHHSVTSQNFVSLLLSPINAYSSVLTLLALPNYNQLLLVQPFGTRRSIAHAVVASVLKNETIISTPQEVQAILDMCHVLIKDQRDVGVGMPNHPGLGNRSYVSGNGRGHPTYDVEEMAEEQGWIARMVHLFQSEDLSVQLDLLLTAHKAFNEGGDRVRWTFPPLVTAAVKLARRYKWREHYVADFATEVAKIFRLIYRWTNDLYARVESSDVCLRLNLLALQAADDAELEDFAYEFTTAAFTIYEESISESKAQLQAVTLIIGTLQQCRVFTEDNYDKIVTKAAVTGAKLLKKGHQATAVAYAAHLWWQTDLPGKTTADEKSDRWLCRDGKRVLECLQKTLRVATSCIDELTTMQIYVDALEHYLYFFDRRVPEITAKHISTLIELIAKDLDTIQMDDAAVRPSASATSGLIEGVGSGSAVIRHFKSLLLYIHARNEGNATSPGAAASDLPSLTDVSIAGPMLKLGL